MNKIARVILTVVLVLLLLPAGCFVSSESRDGGNVTVSVEGTNVGNLAPDFQLRSLDGEFVSLGDLRGKPVLINFWATWCPPCRNEMPYLQGIYEEWSGLGLEVLAINIGEDPSKVEEFMRGNNLSFAALLDIGQDVTEEYGITGIPATFFVDKDGIIQDKVVGAFQNKTQIENRLSSIMP